MSAFKQAVEQIIKENEKMIIVSGIVKAVRDNAIDVEREGMADIIDVRLSSVLNGVKNQFKVVPKVGTAVMCGIIENDKSEAILLTCSEVDQVSLKIDDLIWKCDTEGVEVTNKGENLRTVIGDLITEVNKIKVIYGNDVDHVKLLEIKVRMEKILK